MNSNLVNSEFRILTKDQIEFEAKEKGIFSEPDDDDAFGENYYYARVGSWFMKSSEGTPRQLDDINRYLDINPYEYIILTTHEIFQLPKDIFAFIGFRSHYIQKGLIPLAGITIDPGYTGTLTLGFYNSSPITIKVSFKEKICKLIFYKLIRPVTTGHEHLNRDEENARRAGMIPPSIIEYYSHLEELERLSAGDRIEKVENKIKSLESSSNQLRNTLYNTALAITVMLVGLILVYLLKTT